MVEYSNIPSCKGVVLLRRERWRVKLLKTFGKKSSLLLTDKYSNRALFWVECVILLYWYDTYRSESLLSLQCSEKMAGKILIEVVNKMIDEQEEWGRF